MSNGNIEVEGINYVNFNSNGSLGYSTASIDGQSSNILLQNASTEAIILNTIGAGPRAVQRSIHDAHGEDCTDAAEGDAMPTI